MSAQDTSTKKVADLTETISSNLTSLLTELIRASPPEAPSPPSLDKKFNKILWKLQTLTSEIGSIRSDLHSVKAHTDCEREEAQKKLMDGTNLLDLLDLGDTNDSHEPKIMPVEKNNEIARRYNSELRHPHDFIAPLYNPRGNRVFGFPTTVGDLLNLDGTAEELLCAAFGLKYERNSKVFMKFCGLGPVVLSFLASYATSGSELAAARVRNRHKRATDLEAAGNPTKNTKKAAARHNAEARKHNACADDYDYEIIPILDERNLVVPGSPTKYHWFFTPHRRDVLYLLGEYGLDVEPEGCLKRFEAFVGVPLSGDRETRVEWLL